MPSRRIDIGPGVRPRSPLRLLGVLLAGALVVAAALASSAAPRSVPPLRLPELLSPARADSDSTAVGPLPDTPLPDTTDTARDTTRALLYLPHRRPDPLSASLFGRKRPPLSARIGTYWKHSVELDSTGRYFTAREHVGGEDVRYPVRLDFDRYRQARLQEDMSSGWRSLVEQRARLREQQRRGGLGVNIVVPGGRQSAFSTIFGKPQVDLRVTGQAYIQAGFNHRKSDQQVAFTGRAGRTDPTFKQDLSLGITGAIGDKLHVDVSWDTGNQFDYQNQLKLHYEGYEDEIIQRIEAGNVFLQTPSSLIRGGQSLFGIKSEFQIGGIHLTTVASQQEGQSNNLSLEGGSETVAFDLRPTDYDSRTHFFLSYYFRNRWEDALAEPPNVIVHDGFERITDIEVWKLQQRSVEEQDVRAAVALVDLGEPQEILTRADDFATPVLPGRPGVHQYDESEIENELRESTTPKTFLTAKGLNANDWQSGKFKRLERGRDYEIDEVLGYVSLRQRLQDSEALAVAFRYVAGGQVHTVGDFSAETGGARGGLNDERLVLKLLRPVNLTPPGPDYKPAAWYLELRNIYRLRSYGITPNDFDLQIQYEPPGRVAEKILPGVGGRQTLLQLLGLDRLNLDQAPTPDNQFDYLVNYTIDPGRGLLLFPYLEPFGGRLASLIGAEGPGQQELHDRYVFERLYAEKPEQAQRDTQHDVYRIQGSYKGAVQSFYDLGAYAGLVENSVRVTSGGTPLQEGIDFTVDYQGGTVTVTNPSYLTAGRNINISYEQNQFVNFQKKTLLGARADYNLDDRLDLGATVMRLSQKSPVDKFRIGEEPISNLIWGLDGRVDLEPRWLTRAVDALPFLQTKAPSAISISGEIAQFRPGNAQTIAFERTRKELLDQGRDFNDDELSGVSYLDDFEGFETTYSLKQAGAWMLSAAPDSIGAVDPFAGDPRVQRGAPYDSLRTTWRGALAWYTPNPRTLDEMEKRGLDVKGDATRVVHIKEVFPSRDTRGETNPFLSTLDLYFNPRARGPYNYTTDLPGFLENPEGAWSGITQRLPDGYNDFNLKNIEFIEFVFQPFSETADRDAGGDAKLYVDLGFISEDIIPDENLNTEDGLTTATVPSGANISRWSRLPSSTQNSAVDVDDQTGRTEDLGLDGLASYDGSSGLYGAATEQEVFRHFLERLPDCSTADPYCRAEVARTRHDPSGDDYQFFGNDGYFANPDFYPPELYPNGAPLQERFLRYFPGLELNSFEAQKLLASNTSSGQGNARYPDSEDLNLNSTVDTDNSYFQYEVPLSRAVLDAQAEETAVDDYVVTEITDENGVGRGWYQVRIPVREFTRRAGTINDFSTIQSIRLWTTGHEAPVTIRFATLELVGSQWQKAHEVAAEERLPGITRPDTTAVLTISSVNNEENSNVYASPSGAVIAQNRLATGTVQNAREQAMVLRVEDLQPGQQRAISKTFHGYDLLKYQRLRMFVHMHGQLAGADPAVGETDLGRLAQADLERARSKAKLFVRLGANATNDYYEYEQPLTPSPQLENNTDILWQTYARYGGDVLDLGSVNLDLDALNQLKVARDEGISLGAAVLDSVFWNADEGGGQLPGRPGAGAAPPGTRIGVKGNPSLNRINTIVIGVRNPADPASPYDSDVLEDVTVWINELRTSGYDAKSGVAGLFNADIRLADVGRFKANFSTQTDGFGSLTSTLDDRDQTSLANWGVITDLNLDKFIPERYGWQLPVSVQMQSNTSTPRYSPSRGDVRLENMLDLIEEQPGLDAATKEEERRRVVEAAQTHSRNRSFTARVQKQGSDSKLLRHTLDGVSLSYSYSDADGRSPSLRTNDSWRWNGALSYNLNVRRPRTVRPFWFLDALPVLSLLGDLQFNYVPQRVSFSGTAARNFAQSQDRPRLLGRSPDALVLPDEVAYPWREQQSFTHRRNLGLQYNPFGFLNLSFDTNVNKSLNGLAADTLHSVLVRGEDPSSFELIENMSRLEAVEQGLVAPEAFDQDLAYELSRLGVVPTGRIVGDLFGGTDPRTERYDQRFNVQFQPRLNDVKALDWISLGPFTYGANFNWQNGAVGRNTGANVGNQIDLRGGLSVQPQMLWRKFDFYKEMEQEQRQREQEKEAERRQREQEDQQIKQAEERWRRAVEEAEKNGQEPPEREQMVPERSQPDDGGFELSMPDPLVLLQKTFMALTGVREFRVTYTGNRSANASNVGRPLPDGGVAVHHSLLDALRGDGASFGYRFGLDRHIGDQRVLNDRFQVTDQLSDNNRIQAQTSLNPTRNFQINLSWNTDWNQGENITYRPDDLPVTTENGTHRASIWAFGASYLDLFQRQLDTYLEDYERAGDVDVIDDASGDGRVVLSNNTVVEDFQSAFVSSFGTLDRRGLLPFPMPTWTVNYSGISNWPLIRSLVQSASIRHGYSADYSTDFRTNLAGGPDAFATIELGGRTGGRTIQFNVPDYQVNAIRVNERFQPLVGLDLMWKGRLQTNVAWNKSSAYALGTANQEVGELQTDELSLTASYNRQGMRLPLPFLRGKRLNNRISFSLTLSLSETSDRRYSLRRALETAILSPDPAGFPLEDALIEGENVSVLTATRRLSLAPKISYQFSNRVSSDFVLRYEQFRGDSRQPSFSTLTGNFNVRVSISN